MMIRQFPDKNRTGLDHYRLDSLLSTLQLAANDYLTTGINSMNLEDRLGDVETDCRDRLHG